MPNFIVRPAAMAVLLCGMLVSACDPVSFAGVEAASVMGSDKTLVDHAISFGSGKNCSTLRLERGQTYCAEDAKRVHQNLYCYRNLTGVTCYDRPDPYKDGQQRVDRNEQNVAK